MREGELHLMIIWERARYKQDIIINDLRSKFDILELIEVTWSPSLVSSNYTRFYGVKLPDNSFKERECGTGAFLLVLLWDNNPVYEERTTTHGREITNTKMFDSKMEYRGWTGGGHKVHGSTSTKETNHDLTLLLGINYDDYLKTINWNQTIERSITKDIEGAHGWDSFEHFIYVINNTIDYVVLRGEEIFKHRINDLNQDIDILVNNYQNFIFLTNGKQVWSYPLRPREIVAIDDKQYLLDLWDVDYNYHSHNWHESMISERILDNGFYVLNDTNKFFSLLYHCLYHKQGISKQYKTYIINELEKRQLTNKDNSCGDYILEDICYPIIQSFLDKHGYDYVFENRDCHLFQNTNLPLIKSEMALLKSTGLFQDVKPYKVCSFSISGYRYFTANYQGKHVFVKFCGIGDSCKNEYAFTKRMYDFNNIHFLEPLLFSSVDNKPFLVFEYTIGTPLCEYAKLNREDISGQLSTIMLSLSECKVVHRDIRPDNFIVVDGCVKLLDFQFAIDCLEKKELSCINDNYIVAINLGKDEHLRKSVFYWNDVYSYRKMCEQIGVDVNRDISGQTILLPWHHIKTYIRQFLSYKINGLKNKLHIDKCFDLLLKGIARIKGLLRSVYKSILKVA